MAHQRLPLVPEKKLGSKNEDEDDGELDRGTSSESFCSLFVTQAMASSPLLGQWDPLSAQAGPVHSI